MYHVTFWNPDANGGAGAFEVMSGTWANVNITDDQTGQIVNNYGMSIGEDGEFAVCTWAGVGYNGSIKLMDQGGNSVTPDGAFFAGGNTQDYWGYYEMVSGTNQSLLFKNMEATIPESQALLGYSRPIIYVNMMSNINNSYYSEGSDAIFIKTSHTLHEFGIFTFAHEYGHAVHDKALGGIAAYGACPDSHYVDGAYNLGCAWKEGFADFHAAYTRREVLTSGGFADHEFESNQFYQGGDGSIIEGSVAAFLYDLVDGPNDPDGPTNQPDGDDDAVQYPGSYLGTLMRTCLITQFGGVIRGENGIDDLIYCLERQVDPAVKNSSIYFVTRPANLEAVGESESATEPTNWSQSAIRALWTHNLYGQ